MVCACKHQENLCRMVAVLLDASNCLSTCQASSTCYGSHYASGCQTNPSANVDYAIFRGAVVIEFANHEWTGTKPDEPSTCVAIEHEQVLPVSDVAQSISGQVHVGQAGSIASVASLRHSLLSDKNLASRYVGVQIIASPAVLTLCEVEIRGTRV